MGVLTRRVVPPCRVVFALLVLVAIVAQIASVAGTGHFDPVNFFSYFTVLSNLWGAALFLFGAPLSRNQRSLAFELLRGAAVVYLTVTFVVFALLLSGTDVDLALPWVDTVLHRLFPVVIVIDWLVDPPARRIGAGQSLAWLSFPAAWIVYTLIRGALTARYPYPFLDPANGGYATVAVYCVAILVLLVVVSLIVWAAGDLRRRQGSVGVLRP